MCSLKNPSCLRSPSKRDLQRFSFKKFNSELESKAPLFSALLWTASVRKSKRDDEFWQPSVCMSAAVLLKNRSPCMNAMQLINTIILYHSGITVNIFFNPFLSDVLRSCLALQSTVGKSRCRSLGKNNPFHTQDSPLTLRCSTGR